MTIKVIYIKFWIVIISLLRNFLNVLIPRRNSKRRVICIYTRVTKIPSYCQKMVLFFCLRFKSGQSHTISTSSKKIWRHCLVLIVHLKKNFFLHKRDLIHLLITIFLKKYNVPQMFYSVHICFHYVLKNVEHLTSLARIRIIEYQNLFFFIPFHCKSEMSSLCSQG